MIIIRRDLIWAYSAQILNVGLGLIILPVIVRYMSTIEVGLWFVFMTLISLAQLLELGFLPTLARNFAYVYAGIKEISPTGLKSSGSGSLNVDLLRDLVGASRMIYKWIAICASVVLLVGGGIYIRSVIPDGANETEIYIGWSAFALGSIVNFYYGYLNAILQGRGNITAANKVTMASKGIQVAAGIALVIMGMGLLGLGIAAILSAITGRILARHYVYSSDYLEINALKARKSNLQEIARIIWHNASRYGFVMLGVFMIWRANILIASSTLGLAESASYGLAIQIFFLLNTIATVPFNVALPRMNAMRAQGNNEILYKSFAELIALSLLIYGIGTTVLLIMGPYVLIAIGSSISLPQQSILLLMSVIFFLEINHGTCANFITTGNEIPFVRASLYTGISIVAGSLVLAPIYGLVGLVISQAMAQVVYNNWKWPREVGRIFGVPYWRIIRDGFGLVVSKIM